MMSAYNKLVRDRVPEKILMSGKHIQHKINRSSLHTSFSENWNGRNS